MNSFLEIFKKLVYSFHLALLVGLSRNVDGQTPGVLRELLVFYMSEAKLSTILLSLPPLGYLDMFQEMFFGFGDFCISFP